MRIKQFWPLPIYFVLAMLMTWPLVSLLGVQVPADLGNDGRVHEWTFWWLKQALLAGENPYFTALLAYPSGVSLTSHNIAWLNFGIWFPLEAAFGATAAHSLTYLIIFMLNAYTMYLFAYDQIRAQAGAFVAGLIFGYFPATLSDAGHVNMLIVGWLPLALLYLDRLIKQGGKRNSVMAGLFLALLGITRWQMLIMGGIVAGVFVLFRLAGNRQAWRLRTVGLLLLTGGVLLLLIAPFALPVVIDQITRPGSGELLIYEPVYSADLLNYVIPSGHLLLWSRLVESLPADWQFPQQEVYFLGYTVLVLAAVGLVGRWRAAALWLALALLLIVLALGPVITVGKQGLAWLPTPYRLIEELFFNQIIRKPWRYNTFLGLPVAMLAALGFVTLRRWFKPARGVLFVLVVAVLILGEFWLAPYPMTAVTIPPWYRQLAGDPDSFAILGIPISPRFGDKFYMVYQTEHGKPMVGGHVSRPPVESLAYIDESPFLDDMYYRRTMEPALVDVSHQLRYLADADVRYAILHKHFSSAEQIAAWKDWLTFAPLFEDEFVVVYATRPRAGVDFQIEHPLTDEIGLIRAGYEPEQVAQGAPLTVDMRWGAAGAIADEYDHCVRLLAADGTVGQETCALISPDWPTSHWQSGEVARSLHTFRVDPHLAPGQYTVELALRNAATGETVGDRLALDPLDVTALERSFDPPSPTQPAAVTFGDSIDLLGYDLALDGTRIGLTLYWQADERLDRSYKVFVHVLDGETGAMLTQYDAAPRNWAYPTTWWETGEVVDETIDLKLEQPASSLRLLVGLYDEQTGNRLWVHGDGMVSDADAFVIELKP